jgi:hypothetical protein
LFGFKTNYNLSNRIEKMVDKIVEAFKRAAGSPQDRVDFYRQLLEAQIFVPVSANPGVFGEISGVLAQETVPIHFWTQADGQVVIPFYTSLGLYRSVLGQENHLKLPARTIFELSRGSHLMMNPKTDSSKHLFPDEVAAMLTGEIFELAVQPEIKNESDFPSGTQWVIQYVPGENWQPDQEFQNQADALVHLNYFQDLVRDEKIALAGPFMAPGFASLVICAPNLEEDEVIRIARNAPMVAERVVDFQVAPWFCLSPISIH